MAPVEQAVELCAAPQHLTLEATVQGSRDQADLAECDAVEPSSLDGHDRAAGNARQPGQIDLPESALDA
jgi:hypothetical protein